MIKRKLPLNVLCFIYLGMSLLSLIIALLSGVIMGNSGPINIIPILNWLVGIVPFVLILLYALGVKNKIVMLLSLALPLINCTEDLIRLIAQGMKFLLAYGSGALVQTYGIDMFTSILGVAAYVLLILYLLNVFKNKKLAMIVSFVYFSLNAVLYLLSGVSSIINRFISVFYDKYTIYFNFIYLLGMLTSVLAALIWIVYIIIIKNEVLE